MGLAKYRVWVTPLFKGVPGEDEFNITGRSSITEDMMIELFQFGDVDVQGKIGEGRTANLKVRMSEPIVASLVKYEFAVRIGQVRPTETEAEIIFWGQSNLKKRFGQAYVEFEAHDPLALKAKYHQVRRGDIALNVDPERGRITSDFYGLEDIMRAAHNTPEQQNRMMPCFAFPCGENGIWPLEDPPLIGYERFTPVSSLVEQILKSAFGPDLDARPEWNLPSNQYGWMDCYDTIIDHTDPDPDLNLGRYLVPVDPDDPQPGEVVYSYGYGEGTNLDNCENVDTDPERPATHAHYFDSHRVFRETAADTASSAKVGAWVDAVDAGFEIKRSEPGFPADTRPLTYAAESHISAYGVPPEHVTVKLRPADVQPFQIGHPRWTSAIVTEESVVGGDVYFGDYVYVRARRDNVEFEGDYKIIGIGWKQDGFGGLPYNTLELVPAVGGIPVENNDETFEGETPEPSSVTVWISTPSMGSLIDPGDDVTITATTSGGVVVGVQFYIDDVAFGSEDIASPYTTTWDTDLMAEGNYRIKAVARDSDGNLIPSAEIIITIASEAPPPPPPPEGNLLYVDGTKIRKVVDDSQVSMKILNVHTNGFSFPQTRFNQWAAAGITDIRLLLIWKRYETAPGIFSEAEFAHVRTSVARAKAAGIRTMICCAANAPKWDARALYIPSWSYDAAGPATVAGRSPVAPFNTQSLWDCLVIHGEAWVKKCVTEFVADEYVWGFQPGNEPDHYASYGGVNAPGQVIQAGTQILVDWMREADTGDAKIWPCMTTNYSSQDPTKATHNNWALITDKSRMTFNAHCYAAPASPTWVGYNLSHGVRSQEDGQFWNGFPEAQTYNTANKQGIKNHLEKWRQISVTHDRPVILDECGVPYNRATAAIRLANITDTRDAAMEKGFAGMGLWIGGENTNGDVYVSNPTGLAMRPEYAVISGFVAT